MAIGPRLEFRQSQSLVMTPQLRQAIKLLQFSNLEVAAYVEEELERNPLLERDEHSEALPEHVAPDQRTESLAGLDASDMMRREKLPDAVEADHANSFDAGSLADGAPAFSRERGGGGFDGDDRGLDDLAEAPRCLREHLAEQLRLGFQDPVDRLIGAHLITLLDAAGRVSIDSASLADALGAEPARVERVRTEMQRFDPSGAVRAGPSGVSRRPVGRPQPARPGNAGAARQFGPARPPRVARPAGTLRRGRRGLGRDDRRDPCAGPKARRRVRQPARRRHPA